MKNHEKEIKKLLSDDMLRPSESFKRNLKRDMLRAAGRKKPGNRFVIPALAASCAALAIVAGALLTFDTNNVARNPFQPHTVSAKELIRKISELPKTLGESDKSFVVSKATFVKGPAFGWCSQEGLGDMAGGMTELYVFNAPNSGHEALYIKYMPDSGAVRKTQYYNKNAEEMRTWSTGYNTDIPFINQAIGDKPFYILVDKEGGQLKDDTLHPKELNGRTVYEFYLKVNPEGLYEPFESDAKEKLGVRYCDPTRTLTKVTVDARTNSVMETVEYVDAVQDANAVRTNKYEGELKDVDESAALSEMTKAGFNKDEAVSQLPGGKD